MIRCAYENNKNNFGDMLTPIIVEWISGEKCIHVKCNEPKKLLCIGSGMNRWIRDGDVIWGYGSRNTDQYGKIKAKEGVQFLAVRGKMTRENILKDNPDVIVPEVYGDPALLMPKIYKPLKVKKYRIGLISHYIDKARFKVNDINVLNIDIQGNVYKVIDQINSCESIISTSMHGVIVSEAYGLPVVWLQVSNRVLGGWFKFNDYFSGTGREKQNPIKIMEKIITRPDITRIKYKFLPPPNIDTTALEEAWKGCNLENIRG